MKKFIFISAILFLTVIQLFSQSYSDAALAKVRKQDSESRDAGGKLQTLSASEHAYRADVYSFNRVFPEAREHWAKILENYPADALVPKALVGTGRSFMWERQYEKAIQWFDKLFPDFINTREGREGLAFKGACLVRLGKNVEAAKTYEQYTVMFPTGEKIESAYLNIIDAWREAGKYENANLWVDKARTRFSGMPTATNALQARLRMDIYRQNWMEVLKTSDDLLLLKSFNGSMTNSDEVKYLRGLALEKLNRKGDAIIVYQTISNSLTSYYGGLADVRLQLLNAPNNSIRKTGSVSLNFYRDYPVVFRTEILRSARSLNIDPRFVLAIMKQESSFRANAKSPSAARGLLQLVYDTAIKYNKKAGYPGLKPDDLYLPSVNIAIGTVYMADLKEQFSGLYEAIAASYNGGEDNAARWLNRAKPKDAGIFVSEIGFPETKDYVYKVMGNYRVYRELYTEDLQKR